MNKFEELKKYCNTETLTVIPTIFDSDIKNATIYLDFNIDNRVVQLILQNDNKWYFLDAETL
jgi:hypothetical protein